jgi:hypothetical protein
MSCEIFASISTEVRIWGCECDLSKLATEYKYDAKVYTYQVKNGARQDAVNCKVNTTLHGEKTRNPK